MRTALIILVILLALPVSAALLETNEWSDKTRAGWSYNGGYGGTGAVIDGSMAVSPSGGTAIKMVQPSGMPGGVGGGTATYSSITGRSELYVGFWLEHSSNYMFHPICSKFFYMVLDGPDSSGGFTENFLVCVLYGGQGIWFTPQLQQAPGTKNFTNNIAQTPFNLTGRWNFVEIHAVLNTVGQENGIAEVWINDVLVLQHTNVGFRSSNRFFGWQQLNSTWGGGGSALTQEQYMWFDHTVISTTRIGMPGGSVSADQIPPVMPRNFVVQ